MPERTDRPDYPHPSRMPERHVAQAVDCRSTRSRERMNNLRLPIEILDSQRPIEDLLRRQAVPVERK